jgi:hypothetical protein
VLTVPCHSVTLHRMDGVELTRSHPAVRWPDPKAGPWSISFTWAEIDGRYECVAVEIRGGHEPWRQRVNGQLVETIRPIPGAALGGVTTELFRSIPIASLIGDARRDLLDMARQAADRIDELGKHEIAARLRAYGRKFGVSSAARGRPRLYDADHYAEVARVYMAAYRSGEHPRQAVAEQFGTSPSNAAKWVAKARKDGLLEPTKPGRAGWAKKPPTKRRGGT